MHVVSISLGSSRRDHRTETTLLGKTITWTIGTDGDQKRACQFIWNWTAKWTPLVWAAPIERYHGG